MVAVTLKEDKAYIDDFLQDNSKMLDSVGAQRQPAFL